MKRFLLIVMLGFVAGAMAHIGFYAFRRPTVENRLTRDLAWMQSVFDLNDTQYRSIRALHQRTGPELERLFTVLRTTHDELDRLEEMRRTADKVDFIAFHQAKEANRKARLQCRTLTLDLVYAVAEVMSPEQRARYFALVGNGVELAPPPAS
jgi:beta-xylosidase